MCKIINKNGEIFRIDAAHFYAEKLEYKGAFKENNTFEVKSFTVEQILAFPEFEGFEPFTDKFDFDTNFRCFIEKSFLGEMAFEYPELAAKVALLRHTKYKNGIEFYFDEIDEEFLPFTENLKIEKK